MDSATSTQDDSPAAKKGPSGRRSPTRGILLLFAGLVVAGVGVLAQGWLVESFFGNPEGPFVQPYYAYEWGQAYATILVGAGILVAGIGWTLEQRAREHRLYPLRGMRGSTRAKFGDGLVLTGAVTAAGGQFLTAALTILGLHGVYSLANALGPGWSAGEYDVLLGAGLLLVAAGIFVLALTGRLTSPRK